MTKPRHKLFERTSGWHYMSASLEGAACLFVAIVAGVSLIGLGIFFADVLDKDFPKYLGIAAALALAVAFMRFAHKHS